MTTPKPQTFASRVRAAVEAPLGERWRQPLIEASVFFTYTFHRRQFEEHLLPELYGLPDRGERGARLALLQQQLSRTSRPVVLHDDHVPVEVDEEGNLVGRAALAGSVSFRLDAVPVRWGGGGVTCMHAKHTLLRVRDADLRRRGAPREALVVVTTSANLTLAGWRQNVELADIQCVARGQATPLRGGLVELVEDAWSWARRAQRGDDLDGLRRIQELVDTLRPSDEPLPRLWTGREQGLVDALVETVARTDVGPIRRLSLGAPYMTEDAAPIQELVERLKPREVAVLQPTDSMGRPLGTAAWEQAVRRIDAPGGAPSLHPLHPDLRDDKNGRTTHLKWVLAQGASRSVLVVGSPNLSDPAFGPHTRPGTNYETAIFLEFTGRLRLLDPAEAAPLTEAISPEAALDPNGPAQVETAPFFLTYDWSLPEGKRARAVPADDSERLPAPSARVRSIGSEGDGVSLDLDGGQVGAAACALVHDALDHSPFVELLPTADEDRPPRLVSIVELRQDHAPVRDRFGLSLDQWLRFVTAMSLEDWRRAEREADRIDRLQAEQAEHQRPTRPARPPIQLDRPIRIIQAVQSLERRARRALSEDDSGALIRTLIEDGGVSLRSLVGFHLSSGAASDSAARPDLVDQLVCWLSVQTLLDDLEDDLSPDARSGLEKLKAELSRLGEAWKELDAADRDQLKQWLRSEWCGPPANEGERSRRGGAT